MAHCRTLRPRCSARAHGRWPSALARSPGRRRGPAAVGACPAWKPRRAGRTPRRPTDHRHLAGPADGGNKRVCPRTLVADERAEKGVLVRPAQRLTRRPARPQVRYNPAVRPGRTFVTAVVFAGALTTALAQNTPADRAGGRAQTL